MSVRASQQSALSCAGRYVIQSDQLHVPNMLVNNGQCNYVVRADGVRINLKYAMSGLRA